MITQEELKEVLFYCKETGIFTWKVKPSKRIMIGGKAGFIDGKGYTRICINGTYYFAHRLAWIYVTGNTPDNQIDHINLIKSDNRWCNLRAATNSQNNMNRKANKTNLLGIKNISKSWNRYVVRIISNKKLYKKTFCSLDEAKDYCDKMRNLLHGDFANA